MEAGHSRARAAYAEAAEGAVTMEGLTEGGLAAEGVVGGCGVLVDWGEEWCRGVVEKVAGDRVLVHYTDFGYAEWVAAARTVLLPEELARAPVQGARVTYTAGQDPSQVTSGENSKALAEKYVFFVVTLEHYGHLFLKRNTCFRFGFR